MRSKGFALPTVLISSVVMMVVLTSALATVSSVSKALYNQYYSKLAREAAESGLAYAYNCLNGAASNPVTPGYVLTPSSGCGGIAPNNVPACSGSYGGVSNAIMNIAGRCTTFIVTNIQTGPSGGVPYTVTVNGVVNQLRTSNGAVARTVSQQMSQVIKYGTVPTLAGGAGWQNGGHDGYMLSPNGTLYGWGDNTFDQITDNGSPTTVTAPTIIKPPANVTKINKIVNSGIGSYFVCMLATTSNIGQQVYCRGGTGTGDGCMWGVWVGSSSTGGCPSNGWIQFGSGARGNVPDRAKDGTIRSTNSAPGFQTGFFGSGGLTAVDLVVQGYGQDSICVVGSDSLLYCAGSNEMGEFGIGPYNGTATNSWVPWTVPLASPAKVTTVGIVNDTGTPAGNVAGTFNFTPNYTYPTGPNYKVALKSDVLCVFGTNNATYCAGRNDVGQLITNNTTTNNWVGDGYFAPLQPGAGTSYSGKTPQNIWLGYHTWDDEVVLQTTDNTWLLGGTIGSGHITGGSQNGIMSSGSPLTTYFQSAISASEDGNGARSLCVLNPVSGSWWQSYPSELWCRGSNGYGELGLGNCNDYSGNQWQLVAPDTRTTTINGSPATQYGIWDYSANTWVVPAVFPDKSLGSQMNSVMAYQANTIMFISTAGDVWAAGDNSYGKVGTNSTTNISGCASTSIPRFQKIPLPNGVKAVMFSNSDPHTAYILGSDGRLYSLGGNDNGQLGNTNIGVGSSSSALQVVQFPTTKTTF